jgi:hypothetical protein
MKLIKGTNHFKYYKDDNNHTTTHNTGQYDMFLCGCLRQPIQRGKNHLSEAFCAVHKTKTRRYGILDTRPLPGFKYDKDGSVILSK